MIIPVQIQTYDAPDELSGGLSLKKLWAEMHRSNIWRSRYRCGTARRIGRRDAAKPPARSPDGHHRG